MNICTTPAPPVIGLIRPRAVTGQSGIFTRLSAGGNRIRTIGSAGGARILVVSVFVRAHFSACRESSRSDEQASKTWSCHAEPIVRILFPPVASQLRTCWWAPAKSAPLGFEQFSQGLLVTISIRRRIETSGPLCDDRLGDRDHLGVR